MTKKAKLALIVITAILILFALSCLGTFLLIRHWKTNGELVKTSISPEGRWKVRLYYWNGVMDDGHRADVIDLKGKVPTRNIYRAVEDSEVEKRIQWKNSNTVILNGHQIDVRKNYDLFNLPPNI